MQRSGSSLRFSLPSLAVALGLAGVVYPAAASAQSLRGSPASVNRQHRRAEQNGFTFLRTPAQVDSLVDEGRLVPVTGNRDYELNDVSFDVARPAVKVFIDRLSAQYREACHEPLVVTSLTRPLSDQPPNASPLSVHPTGMAVDLRRPADSHCRAWLEFDPPVARGQARRRGDARALPAPFSCRRLRAKLPGLRGHSDGAVGGRAPDCRAGEVAVHRSAVRHVVGDCQPVRHDAVRVAGREPPALVNHPPR